jgi:uncharacterized cupredoxin-like copper-binding protein
MHRRRPSHIRLVAMGIALVALAGACGPARKSVGHRVDVSLRDFRIETRAASLPRGAVTFVVHNRAPATHEFVIFRTELPADALPIAADGLSVDEDRVHHVDELDEVPAGTTATLTLQLPPGHYVLICNLEGHYLGGMHHGFTVTPTASGADG